MKRTPLQRAQRRSRALGRLLRRAQSRRTNRHTAWKQFQTLAAQ